MVIMIEPCMGQRAGNNAHAHSVARAPHVMHVIMVRDRTDALVRPESSTPKVRHSMQMATHTTTATIIPLASPAPLSVVVVVVVVIVVVEVVVAVLVVGAPREGWGAHIRPSSAPPHAPIRVSPWPHVTLLHA